MKLSGSNEFVTVKAVGPKSIIIIVFGHVIATIIIVIYIIITTFRTIAIIATHRDDLLFLLSLAGIQI